MAAAVTTTITQASRKRMTKTLHAIDGAEGDLVKSGPVVMAELTELLEKKVGEKFEESIMHPEESTGASMKTLHSEAHGISGSVEMAGGAPYKEFGTADHGPVTAQAMHWMKADGTHVFAKHVRGVKAVDFVGEAMEDLDADAVLLAVFEKSFLDIFTEDI